MKEMGLMSEENGFEMACGVERESMRVRNGKSDTHGQRFREWA